MTRQGETIYRATLTLLEGRFVDDAALVVIDGAITEIIDAEDVEQRLDADSRLVQLRDVALIPGQINVHSHAFQRSLRGRTEYRQSPDETDDFWTWRTEMYRLANRFGPDEMQTVAAMAFLEMARAGISRVGEFHYVHHSPDGDEYDEPMELAHRIIAAAKQAGIHITMMPVAYHTGGINEPAHHDQRRFIHDDVDTYLRRVQQLADEFADDEMVDIGLAPHSIRAVPREWLEEIAEFGAHRDMPVHIHVCEQRKEVEESRAAFGMPPIEALSDWGVLAEGWTLIHGTHLSQRELEILEDIRPTIGACPTTERNLGDGFLPASDLVGRGVPIALGSDSHTVIDPFEEMRLVEYHERLRNEERNVLVGADGSTTRTADILWPMGTEHGARSLRCSSTAIREDSSADLVAIDLNHPSIVGAGADTLLTDVVLSMSPGAVRDVIIGGESVIAERRHRRGHEIVEAFRAVMEAL